MAIPLKVNLKSLLVRRTATALTVAGIGLIVMALSVVWGLAEGLKTVFRVGGSPENLVVMRGGSTTETTSGIQDANARIISLFEGIDLGKDGQPLASGELVVIINQPRRGAKPSTDGSAWSMGANVIVRGVGPAAFDLRPNLEIVEGRRFEPGRNEVITSRSMAARFAGCGLGETIMLRRVPCTVVGLFEDEGSPYQSEIWADAKDLGAIFSRSGAVSALLLRSSDPIARERLRAALEADPRLNVDVQD